MTRDLTWRTWLVLVLFALATVFLAGAPVAQAGDDDYEDFLEDLGLDDDLYKDLEHDFYDYDSDADYYDKRWDRIAAKLGGGHGGAGATQVPVVDDDIEFMVAWTRDRLQADAANQHARGLDVTVAVLDGGFDLNHPSLAGNVWPFGYDAIEEDFDVEDSGNGLDDDMDGFTDDGVGHGTFVAGMVLLAAPEALILPIRVRDDEGWGSNDELERGLEFAWAAGASIVNISGEAAIADYKHVREIIERMRADGVVVIVSAGNEGSTALPDLAKLPGTIPVASSDLGDRLATWSNYEPNAGVLLAPGLDLYGPLWADASGYWSGTSFSAGLTSGAAALLKQIAPHLTPADVHQRLLDTADPAFDAGGVPLPNAGRINLHRAVTE